MEDTTAPKPCTDSGNVERFVDRHGEDLRYVTQAGRWLIWDDRRFVEDEVNGVLYLARMVARDIYKEALEADGDRREELQRHWRNSEREPRIRAMVTLAAADPMIAVRASRLDADPLAFNCLNGTLDLEKIELREHSRRDHITKLAPVLYDPTATAPTWNAFQQRICDGDRDLIEYKQRLCGYCLTGLTSEQSLYIGHGTGANGKSTEVNVLRDLYGDYSTVADTSTFLTKRGGGIPNDVARLRGARFVSAVETDANRALAEGLVKQVTGGDAMVARFLFREFFEFLPQFKVWLCVNHKPRIRGSDHAIWRRIHLIPYSVRIPAEEQIPDFHRQLEPELSGILNWCLDGLRLWREGGLEPPKAVLEATAEYKAESDILADFFEERCVQAPNASAYAKDIYKSYKTWAQDAGEQVYSQRKLGEFLVERGFRRKTGTGGYVKYTGLAVIAETAEEQLERWAIEAER
jgi:putative DNA primase/helicase